MNALVALALTCIVLLGGVAEGRHMVGPGECRVIRSRKMLEDHSFQGSSQEPGFLAADGRRGAVELLQSNLLFHKQEWLPLICLQSGESSLKLD